MWGGFSQYGSLKQLDHDLVISPDGNSWFPRKGSRLEMRLNQSGKNVHLADITEAIACELEAEKAKVSKKNDDIIFVPAFE